MTDMTDNSLVVVFRVLNRYLLLQIVFVDEALIYSIMCDVGCRTVAVGRPAVKYESYS